MTYQWSSPISGRWILRAGHGLASKVFALSGMLQQQFFLSSLCDAMLDFRCKAVWFVQKGSLVARKRPTLLLF